MLLDLSSAFDFVDHRILLSRLERSIGISGTILKRFQSFLSNRSFSVSLGTLSFSMARLPCGVPQGLILASLLFLLYMLPLGSMSTFGVLYHCYANDTKLNYIPIKHNDTSAFKRLEACLQEIKVWLTNNFMLLNDDKTQIFQFGPKEHSGGKSFDLGALTPYLTSVVKDLGFHLDNSLKLDKQINTIVSTSFYHIRRLAKVKPFLNRKSFETAFHAFISTRLDYCNSLYVGLPLSSNPRL